MRGTIPPLPQYAFVAWCSVKKKHKDNFTTFIQSLFTELTYSMEHSPMGEAYRCPAGQKIPHLL